ncbi:aldehyde dehydrogenase family protein [Sphingopyxis lindanitolerans]|uniref:aldehyde dehydrogenase (NAD(+)) n=1 Tax=Sphingopyxis lindanitolerans TaxID=2054227 RepID=A0A2S8B126_9SPHN|nr:aldehyde dehydrogenase family protein [Sphingopyxis lindanitolerans]PQM26043.1 aldehyde dehydrogenase family protein [Sphingopyxis lindanitolerans]
MTVSSTSSEKALTLLRQMGFGDEALSSGDLVSASPIDNAIIGRVRQDDPDGVRRKIAAADADFRKWRDVPSPRRGELVRLFGEALRQNKASLGALVTLETGKIHSEGLGEVQEMIDICDFAVGLSRQLYGLTMATERPGHRMMESWHPLGVTAIISAFNFPVAVWAWNACIALVCGNAIIWKPSEKTPITAFVAHALLERVLDRFDDAPGGLSLLVQGGREAGELLVDDPRVRMVSATGSTRMGREIGPRVAARFGRSLLELGGNNAMIVTPSADLALARQAIAFAAVGTAGQRCTSLRRLFVHDSIYDALIPDLIRIFGAVKVGDPLDPATLVGPLIDAPSFKAMQYALGQARAVSGRVNGGERVDGPHPDAFYVRPAIVEMVRQEAIVMDETFAPILYVMRYTSLDDVIDTHNAVPQGLSSSIFTTDLREAEKFLSAAGSDCGIANVNIGPSGAEIGGAFGGEKETGGGRESGSDSWRAYMRRATNTINYSSDLPLAQGVQFEV